MIANICIGIGLIITGALLVLLLVDRRNTRMGKKGIVFEQITYTVMIRNGNTYHILASGLTEEQAREKKEDLERIYDVKIMIE